MAKLFVLNATGSYKVINYRTTYFVDDFGNPTTAKVEMYKSRTIDPREQVYFGDFSDSALKTILDQLEFSCKAVFYHEIETAKVDGIVPLVYSVEHPIEKPICDYVVEHNRKYMHNLGVKRRKRLAESAAAKMNELSQFSNSPNQVMNGFGVDYETVERESDLTNAFSPKLSHKFKVAENA